MAQWERPIKPGERGKVKWFGRRDLPYGFITTPSGEDVYANIKFIGPDTSPIDLQPGVTVSFVRNTDQTGRPPCARDVKIEVANG